VKAALNASSFDWNVVPGTIVITIGKGVSPHATPGQIWLDAGLLDTGRFSWGVVQHEYAHQVDFGLLTDSMRATLSPQLQTTAWWGSITDHAQLGCERFADQLTWAYWPSPDNVMRPSSSSDEGGHMPAAAFRAALGSLIKPATTPSKG
jgi:hypothetical protein